MEEEQAMIHQRHAYAMAQEEEANLKTLKWTLKTR